MTSQNVFGALALERIAQWYTGEPTLNFSFTNYPLPKSNIDIIQNQHIFITFFCLVLVVVVFLTVIIGYEQTL
jgi:hypothetical protein